MVVEGLYSIRGDVAPLREIIEVCRGYGAYLVVDEAHSLGTFGATGLGCAEAQGVLGEVDFIVGTFSKSLAGVGGVCVSDHAELRSLHFLARAYVFTASGSPANLASVRAAIGVVREHPELRDRLWSNVRRFRDGLLRRGYRIGPTNSPIVPIFTGERSARLRCGRNSLAEGAVREFDRAARLPAGECVLRELLRRAHRRAHHARPDIFERVGVGASLTV